MERRTFRWRGGRADRHGAGVWGGRVWVEEEPALGARAAGTR